jgi:hypothetical protein
MSGQSAIWWVKANATNGTEALAAADTTNSAKWSGGEVILFNETSVSSAGGHIFNSEFNVRNSIAENTKVDGNNNEVQDMGLDGIEVQITGLFKDVDATNNDIKKFMAWINEAKTTTGYTEGRFGLRIDDFPYFNMIPTKSTPVYGYVLNSVRFVRDPNKENRAGFVMTLRLGGNVRGWFDANGYSAE